MFEGVSMKCDDKKEAGLSVKRGIRAKNIRDDLFRTGETAESLKTVKRTSLLICKRLNIQCWD